MIKFTYPDQGGDSVAHERSDPDVRDSDDAVGRRVHLLRRHHRRGAQGEGPLRRPADHGEGGHPRPRPHHGDAGAALARHRHARGRSLHRGDVLQHGAALHRRARLPRAQHAGPLPARDQGRPRRCGGARAVHGGGLDVGLRPCQRHARLEPRHRPSARRPLQRAARRDLRRNDAARHGLQPRADHDPPGLDGRGDGCGHRRHERGGGRDRRGGRRWRRWCARIWACPGGSGMWASATTISPASRRTLWKTSSSPAIRAR